MNNRYINQQENSTKSQDKPLLSFHLPLSEEEWKALLEWAESNLSTSSPSGEVIRDGSELRREL